MDGTFYAIVADNDGRIVAECTECKELRKGSDSSTGNFKSHYKAKHKDRAKDLENYLKEADSATNIISGPRQQKLEQVVSSSSSENVSENE